MDFLLTLAGVLVALWLIGMIAGITIGGLIYVLLVVAVIVVLIRIIRGEPITGGH
ncbi:MAG: lmo0937 family membrane protein [Sulfobacillus sp.]